MRNKTRTSFDILSFVSIDAVDSDSTNMDR